MQLVAFFEYSTAFSRRSCLFFNKFRSLWPGWIYDFCRPELGQAPHPLSQKRVKATLSLVSDMHPTPACATCALEMRSQMAIRKDEGFTLIELVVVLAVIAILAAVLTPIISSYVDRAKVSAARNDVKNIAAAMTQFNIDTRLWPIYKTSDANGNVDPNGSVWGVLRGPGDQAGVAPVVDEVGPPANAWTALITGMETTSLNMVLNTNFLGLPIQGARAWRGAYMELGADPWGASYYVTAAHLRPGSTFAAYVISAGSNQTIETFYAQPRSDTLQVGGDDIVQRIQ